MIGLFFLLACNNADETTKHSEDTVSSEPSSVPEPSDVPEPSTEEPSDDIIEPSSPTTEPSSPNSEPSSNDDCEDYSCETCPEECTPIDECIDGVINCYCECPEEEIFSNACENDTYCNGGTCVDVVDTNSDIKVCKQNPPTTMYTCDYSAGEFEMMNECCDNVDCVNPSGNMGYCLAFDVNYCGGAPPQEMNTCRYDYCQQDSDCSAGFVCLDRGVLGEATNQCILAECTSHADCTESSGGRCSAVYDSPTCGDLTLTCTYADSECRHYNDCSNGLCVKNANGTSCEMDMPPPLPVK